MSGPSFLNPHKFTFEKKNIFVVVQEGHLLQAIQFIS